MTNLDPPGPTDPKPVGGKLSLSDRRLSYDELIAGKASLDAGDLIQQLGDGRGWIRVNAALGLAALGHPGAELVPFLRDGDPEVALAAAEAFVHLGRAQRGNLVAIAAALDGARREVIETIADMFSELIGQADAELVNALDTADEVAVDTVARACARRGVAGLNLLRVAARDARTRVRINAMRGISQLVELDQGSTLEVLRHVAREDGVSDVRAAAQRAISTLTQRLQAAVVARHKASGATPAAVPDLELRAMTPAELRAAAGIAPLDELLRALGNPRLYARLNAVAILALQGAGASASALAVLTRDAEVTVRVEAVRALGKLGAGAVVAAPALVRALGDADPAVIAAAETSLADLGEVAAPALVDGLEAPREPHGARVAALLGRLADGPRMLREALSSLSVDVRVNAALGLGALGKARAGAGLQALLTATTGGNARLRVAVAKAIAQLDPRPARAPVAIAIEGFDERLLTDDELARAKAVLGAATVAGLAPHLADARAVVRANAALGLGTLGAEALTLTDALAVGLRDDVAEVRIATARALDRLGDAAVAACAPALVRAMGDAEAGFEAQLAGMLRTRAHPAIDEALARGLDTADARHAQHLCELVCARPAALDILCEAFGRPSAQPNAARGFVMLGKDRLGKGRAVLERARVSDSLQTRAHAHATLQAIDGPPTGPALPEVAGFEGTLLDATAFSGSAKLHADALLAFVRDGRAVVRANAVTALGTLGPAASAFAITIGALLRDDDDRVRIAAARALDKLGDDAVVVAAPYLVAGLRGEVGVAEACRAVLAARKTKVEAALIAGLETSDEVHGMRISELICALPDARDLLFAAFDGEAQNAQINAAFGIAKLGVKRAGPEGRRRLVNGLTGPFTRRREAMVKALAILGAEPSATDR
ncbi:MAG: HEAT repeat domain-containing protein [Proteobacteria bacterium]|nr:HEAT repeat domain-containing protein [Pseudomonadota bacterium]